jgi:hypothetical protein
MSTAFSVSSPRAEDEVAGWWLLRKPELGPAVGLVVAVAVFSALSPYFFDPQSLTAISIGASGGSTRV